MNWCLSFCGILNYSLLVSSIFDSYRWLGPLRFDVAGFIRMIRLRRYPGKVYVLHSKHQQNSSTTEQRLTPPQSPSHKREPESQFQHLLDSNIKEPPKPWSLIPNMPFYSMFLLLNCPNVGETIFFTNTIRFNDGIMRLWYSAETRFWKILMPFIFDQQNGKMVERDLMKDLECEGILVVPGVEGKPDDPSTYKVIEPAWVTSPAAKAQDIYQKPGLFDVDGEVMPTARTLIEIHPSLMNILVPEWLYHTDDDNTTARAHEAAVIQAIKAQQEVHSSFGGVFVVAAAVAVAAAAVFFSADGSSPLEFLRSTLRL